MPAYTYYVFDRNNRIERVVEFTAKSDLDACEEAQRLHTQSGFGAIELWRDRQKVYCPDKGA